MSIISKTDDISIINLVSSSSDSAYIKLYEETGRCWDTINKIVDVLNNHIKDATIFSMIYKKDSDSEIDDEVVHDINNIKIIPDDMWETDDVDWSGVFIPIIEIHLSKENYKKIIKIDNYRFTLLLMKNSIVITESSVKVKGKLEQYLIQF